MRHRLAGLAVCLLFLLGGCGNYQELNEFDIVAGMGVDRTADGYRITLELVNKEGSLQEGLSSNSITLEGETVPKALESAGVRFSKQFHYGNMQVIVISEEIAREEGISELLDCFLRDSSIRETIQLLIATDDSAGDVLTVKGIDSSIVSYALEQIVKPPRQINSHTKEISIYNALDTLNTPGKTLVLPCVRTFQDEDENRFAEINGLAAFQGDRLQLLLPQQETAFYLYALNQMQIHEFAFTLPDGQDQVTIKITESDTKRSFYEADHTIHFRFDITAGGDLSHTPPGINIMDPAQTAAIEQAASESLGASVSGFVTECLQKHHLDIADMRYDLYLWNTDLWEKSERDFASGKPDIAVDVRVKIKIISSGNIRGT